MIAELVNPTGAASLQVSVLSNMKVALHRRARLRPGMASLDITLRKACDVVRRWMLPLVLVNEMHPPQVLPGGCYDFGYSDDLRINTGYLSAGQNAYLGIRSFCLLRFRSPYECPELCTFEPPGINRYNRRTGII
jgi:hypothetical protein